MFTNLGFCKFRNLRHPICSLAYARFTTPSGTITSSRMLSRDSSSTVTRHTSQHDILVKSGPRGEFQTDHGYAAPIPNVLRQLRPRLGCVVSHRDPIISMASRRSQLSHKCERAQSGGSGIRVFCPKAIPQSNGRNLSRQHGN